MVEFRRGDVIRAHLPNNRSGSELKGPRPVVVVQNDGGNRVAPSTIVVPIKEDKGKRYPFLVPLPLGSFGLTKPSVADCCQILTIDKQYVTEKIGRLPATWMADIDAALKIALAL